MIFQRVFPWRSIRTNTALKRLLSSMCSNMCCESVFGCKRKSAQVAGKWLFPCVCVDVVPEVSGDIRGVVAVGAVVQLDGGGRAATGPPACSHDSSPSTSSSANPHLLRMSHLLRVTQVSQWYHERLNLEFLPWFGKILCHIGIFPPKIKKYQDIISFYTKTLTFRLIFSNCK